MKNEIKCIKNNTTFIEQLINKNEHKTQICFKVFKSQSSNSMIRQTD